MSKITTHKTTLIYRGVKFDSDEEVYVAMWLQELKEAGFVKDWMKCVTPIQLTNGLKLKYVKNTQLKTKLKVENKEHTLLKPSEYTPDFEINWTYDGWKQFISGIYNDFDKDKLFFNRNYVASTFLEVKPEFDQNNMERAFRMNQKFVWDKHQIFVNLVEPVSLFKKTFIPLAATPYFKYKVSTKKMLAKGKTKGDWKFDFEPKTLNEFLS